METQSAFNLRTLPWPKEVSTQMQSQITDMPPVDKYRQLEFNCNTDNGQKFTLRIAVSTLNAFLKKISVKKPVYMPAKEKPVSWQFDYALQSGYTNLGAFKDLPVVTAYDEYLLKVYGTFENALEKLNAQVNDPRIMAGCSNFDDTLFKDYITHLETRIEKR